MKPRSRDDFAIAIICALTLEAEAVEDLFDETYDRLGQDYGKVPRDPNAYTTGRIGGHNVVLCYMPGMGKVGAAGVASTLTISYPGVQIALVVGICGGAPCSSGGEIFLGDVIISDAVVQYDFGRQYPDGFQRKTGVNDILGRPNRDIRALLASMRGQRGRTDFGIRMRQHHESLQEGRERWQRLGSDDILFESSYVHESDGDCTMSCDDRHIRRRRSDQEAVDAVVHIGTVASADTVMRSAVHRDAIVDEDKVVGFEMEGAGVWDVLPCIIIKGVCDYADSHKSKEWQAYAAATAASATKTFLEYWPPSHGITKQSRSHWMVPFLRNPLFVGRENEITVLENRITAPDGPKELAITGLGGVGKTQVALELAYRLRDKDPAFSIFWIPCTSTESVEQAYLDIAQMIGIAGRNPSDPKRQVKEHLTQSHTGKWLLIYDNADDPKMWTTSTASLLDFVPQNEQGHALYTSRNHQLAVHLVGANLIPIPEFSEDTGIKVLENMLLQSSLLGDREEAIDLLQQLAFLPLAISQAAAFINRNQIRLTDYLRLLHDQESEKIALLSQDFQDKWRYKDIQNPVAKTWWISFQQIQSSNSLAADYLCLMACIIPRNIPLSFLPQPASKVQMANAIGLLKGYSFVTEQADGQLLSLHRLVHLATRNWLRMKQDFRTQLHKAANCLTKTHAIIHTSLWRVYLPHAFSLMHEDEFPWRETIGYRDLFEFVSHCLCFDGQYAEVQGLMVGVMRTRETMQDHPITQQIMMNLGVEDLHSGHWDMNALASAYSMRERYMEAEIIQLRLIKLSEKVLGCGNHMTVFYMANLAWIWKCQGNITNALDLMEGCAKLNTKILGPKHPLTVSCYHILEVWQNANTSSQEDEPPESGETMVS